MMPLTLANVGEENMIRKVGGKAETRKFLESLGFVAGGMVTAVEYLKLPPLKVSTWGNCFLMSGCGLTDKY